jgi:hypothetical protein
MNGQKMPEYLNASFEGDDLFTGDQLRAAVAAEREACAKVCDDIDSSSDYYGERVELVCAQAIRARLCN